MAGKANLFPREEISSLVDRSGKNHAPAIMALFRQLAQVLSGQITAQHIKDQSLTRALMAADVYLARVAWGRYTGDGTASRIITVSDANGSFSPTELRVLAVTDLNEFYARDDGTGLLAWHRLATGAAASDAAQWDGIVANGFRTGSSAESLSNKSGQVYAWWALRRG